MERQNQVLRRALSDAEEPAVICLSNRLKRTIIEGLRSDANFDMLFCDSLASGAYRTNLKVLATDFAFALPLKFPSHHLVRVTEVTQGTTSVNVSKVIDYLFEDGSTQRSQFLKQISDTDGFILSNKFHSWLEGRFCSYMKRINHELTIDDKLKLSLRYVKQGLAHSIDIKSTSTRFSMKFLPFLVFEDPQPVMRDSLSFKYFEIIPMPIDSSFRRTHAGLEGVILAKKNQLRHALRLMMKFRDARPCMKHLKSYHLKSIFLWTDDEMGCAFWNRPVLDILREVFRRVYIALESKEIKCFWQAQVNLLENVSRSKIESMNDEVKATLRLLERPVVNLLGIFLTFSEQMKYGLESPCEKIVTDKIFQMLSSAINIDADRERYTKMYDFVRNSIIKALKENANFKVLFSDLKLAGSYADNLKITKPNEFDLIMRLQFPHNDLVRVIPDPQNRGNVFLQLSVVLKTLFAEEKYELYKFLRQMVNADEFLLQDKFQSWLESLVSVYVRSINNELTYENGCKLLVRYSKQGPAHTIDIRSGECAFSIDFVPGFQFKADKSTSVRPLTRSTDVWEAIPKPMGLNNPSFRTSFADSERAIFQKKNQFKNVLRLMKKFRDANPKLVHLKSYFIKTLFLWHDEECDSNLWTRPTFDILKEMFDVVEKALAKQEIKFFWDAELNMLSRFSSNQIISMYHDVKSAKHKLNCAESTDDILRLFLGGDEIDQLQRDGIVFPVLDNSCDAVDGVRTEVADDVDHLSVTTIRSLFSSLFICLSFTLAVATLIYYYYYFFE